MIGHDTKQVLDFARDVLVATLPRQFRWRIGDREMREKMPWGHRGVYVQVISHGGPSGVMLSPRLRHDGVERFYNEHRAWNRILLSEAEIGRISRTSVTWGSSTSAPRGEQPSISLPAEEAWLSERIAKQAAQALALLEEVSDPMALLHELQESNLARAISLCHVLGLNAQGLALCRYAREKTSDRVDHDELVAFANSCSQVFSTNPIGR